MNKSYKLDKFIFHPELDQVKITKLFQIISKLDIYELQQYSLINQIYLNVTNNDGECLIHEVIKINNKIATQEAMINVITYLYRNNVNPDKPDKYNKTPLHLACFYQYTKVIEYLLSINANPNYQDNFGQTPFHYIMLSNIKLYKSIDNNNDSSNSSNLSNSSVNIDLLKIKNDLIKIVEINPFDANNSIKLTINEMLNEDILIKNKIINEYEEIFNKIDKDADTNNFTTLFNQSIAYIDKNLNTKFKNFNLSDKFKFHKKSDNFYAWSPINNDDFNLIIDGDDINYFKNSINTSLTSLKKLNNEYEIIDDKKFSEIKLMIINDSLAPYVCIRHDHAACLIDFKNLTFINSIRAINISYNINIIFFYNTDIISYLDLDVDIDYEDIDIAQPEIITYKNIFTTTGLKKIFMKHAINNNIISLVKNNVFSVPILPWPNVENFCAIGDDYLIMEDSIVFAYYTKWMDLYPRYDKDKVKEWMFNMYCDLSTTDIYDSNLNCTIEYYILFMISADHYNLSDSVKKNLVPYYIYNINEDFITSAYINIYEIFIILIKIILLLLHEDNVNIHVIANPALNSIQDIFNNIPNINSDTSNLIKILFCYHHYLTSNRQDNNDIITIIDIIQNEFKEIQFENINEDNIEHCICKIFTILYNNLTIKPYIRYVIDISYIINLYSYNVNINIIKQILKYLFKYDKNLDRTFIDVADFLPGMRYLNNVGKIKIDNTITLSSIEYWYCYICNFLGLNYIGSFYKYSSTDIAILRLPDTVKIENPMVDILTIPEVIRDGYNMKYYSLIMNINLNNYTNNYAINSHNGYYLFLLKKISKLQIISKIYFTKIVTLLDINYSNNLTNLNEYTDNFIEIINYYYNLINNNLLIIEYNSLYEDAKKLTGTTTADRYKTINITQLNISALTNNINNIISKLYIYFLLNYENVISNYYELNNKYIKKILIYNNRANNTKLFTYSSMHFKTIFKDIRNLTHFSKIEEVNIPYNTTQHIAQLFYNNIHEYLIYIIILPYIKKLINVIKIQPIFTIEINKFVENKINIKYKDFVCYKILLNLLNTIITEKCNDILRIQVIDYYLSISNNNIFPKNNIEYNDTIQFLIEKHKYIKIKTDYINTDIITYANKNYKNYNFNEINTNNQQYILYSNNLNNIERSTQRYYLNNEINLIKILLKYNGLPLIKNVEGVNIIGNIIKNYNIELLQELKNIDKNFIINDVDILNILVNDNLDNINKILANIDNINIIPINKILYNIDNCLYNSVANYININDNVKNIIYLNQSLYINSYITLQYLSEHLLNINKHFTYDDLQYLLNKMNINLNNVNLNYLNENLHNFNIPVDINSYIIPKLIEQEDNKLTTLKNELSDINDIINILTTNNKQDLILIQIKQRDNIKNKIKKIENTINILKSTNLDNNKLKSKHSINSKIIHRYDDLDNIDKSLILESWKRLLKSNIENNYNLIPLFLLKLQRTNIDLLQSNINKIEFNKILKAFRHLSILCASYFISSDYTDENKVLGFVKDLLIYLTKTTIGNSIEKNIRIILFNYYSIIYPNNNQNIDSIINNILNNKIINYSYSILDNLYDDLCSKLVENICMIFDNIDSKNNSKIDSEYELTSYFISMFNILDIRLPNELILELENIFTDTLNSTIKKIILLWRTNIENIFSFIINNYRCLKITDIIIN